MRRILAAFILAISTSAAPAQIVDVRPGDLPPITPDYRERVARWAARFYRDPDVLRGGLISDPVLTRDSSGRLLWLVCVEAAPRGANGTGLPPQRQALGFAPRYVTAPLARNGSSLDRTACETQPLTWRPVAGTVTTHARRRR